MNDISHFLSSQSDTAAVTKANTRAERYLSATDALYSRIESWLKDSIDSGFVTGFVRRPIPLMEQVSGSYSAPELVFSAATTSIRFIPKGANVMGAEGRIDAQSSRGRHALIVLIDGSWHFVDPVTKLKRSEMSESGFLELLKHLMGN